MPTFPTSLKINSSSLPLEDAGIVTTISEGGNVRARRLFDSPVVTIRVELWATATEKTTLDDFYTANRDNWNEISIDGRTFDFLFTTKPQVIEKQGGLRRLRFSIAGKEQ